GARGRVDGAPAREPPGSVVAAGTAQTSRRRPRARIDHGVRNGGRGRAPRAAGGPRGRRTAADPAHAGRDAMSFDSVDLVSLRRRRSEKWTAFPADVLPSHIAEMDFPLAAPIEQALVAAVQDGDVGYARAEG